MKIPYGFRNNDGNYNINSSQAEVVKTIYRLYLTGYSLGRIVEHLAHYQIISPSGKVSWGRAAIDKLLSNRKYRCGIIPLEQFVAVQEEKERRSNITEAKQRKVNRYHSASLYGGCLTCGHCGRSYRRITRPSGEIVWRCADRVENGRNASCRNGNSIPDEVLASTVCSKLQTDAMTMGAVRAYVRNIHIYADRIDIVSC